MIEHLLSLWAEIEFGNPWVAWLLPLPLLVYWWWPEFREHSESVRVPNLVSLTGRSGYAASKGKTSKKWPYVLVGLLWCSLLATAAKPERLIVAEQQEIAVRDILLVLDISGSMAIRDMQDEEGETSRMQVMQQAVTDFIHKRAHDNIGVVVFGSQALPLTPMSRDHAALLQQIEEMVPGMAGPQTSIGDAMGVAVKTYRQMDRGNSSETLGNGKGEGRREAKERMMVLLTDGLDTSSVLPPRVALRLAQKQQITIHTIAFGDVKAEDSNGSIDTRLMQEIAEKTSGSYHRASESLHSLQQVYDAIDKLAPRKIQQVGTTERQPLFGYPLKLSLALLLVLLVTVVLSGLSAKGRNNQAETGKAIGGAS